MRKVISYVLKFGVILTAFAGVIIGFFQAQLDGYSAWYKRLYFFTTQSNLWISVTMLLIVIFSFIHKNQGRIKDRLYLLKFIFTVSITITGLIFCAVLAPFAPEDYHPWSINSLLVHVFCPVLSIIDFFVDDFTIELKTRHFFYPLIPPLIYFIFACILGACDVTFRGVETYAYFFLNFDSPVGWFGIDSGPIPSLGSIYWIVFIFSLIIGFSFLYGKLHHSQRAKRKQAKNRVE